jgi:Flp pilus assembly protein TadG
MVQARTGALPEPAHPRRTAGQSLTEVALVLPILFLLVLGAVDIARALSAQQRLERAAHLVAQRLATNPTLPVTTNVQQESGLQPSTNVSAGTVYTTTPDLSDQVIVTATYTYPLLLRLGTLRLTSQAAGIAATTAPSFVVTRTAPMSLSVVVPSDATTAPVGLQLTCTVAYSSTVAYTSTVNRGSCSPTVPFYWPTTPESGLYTATVTQNDGVTSPVISPPITVTLP